MRDWVNGAVRLGFGKDERLLILHADDAGMCHSANAATIKAMTEGVVSSTSVMVPCPWFPEIAAWAREHPHMDVGVHLTLTSEWTWYRWRPVSPVDRVPGLVDGEGFLWRTVPDVAQHASVQEVETELRAQIERAIQFGIRPTHLDSHMGAVFARPDFFDVYVRLSKEFRIPAMLAPPAPGQIEAKRVHPGVADRLRELVREGYPLLDRIETGASGSTFDERKASFYNLIRGLAPGVTHLIVHLSGADEEVSNIAPSWRQRYHELLLCISAETRSLLEQERIRLIGYRPIAELWASPPDAPAHVDEPAPLARRRPQADP